MFLGRGPWIVLLFLAQACSCLAVCPQDGLYKPDPTKTKCFCAAGAGSHVKGWTTNDKYPVTAPSCRAFIPSQHNVYKSTDRFPPKGGGQGRCYCFRCPLGYSASGGALNSKKAQCTRQPVQVVFINAQIQGNTSTACNISVTRAARRALESAVSRAVGVDSRTPKAQSVQCTGSPSQGGIEVAGNRLFSLVLKVTFSGSKAAKNRIIKTVNSPKPSVPGVCSYGVCEAIKRASGSKATVLAATATSALPSPSPPPPPPPPPPPQGTSCQLLVHCPPAPACSIPSCSSGLCQLSPALDNSSCQLIPNAVAGARCTSGMCVGLHSEVSFVSTGTAPGLLIFAAKFPSTNFVNKTVFLYRYDPSTVGNSTNGNTTQLLNAATLAGQEEIGELFDQGDRDSFDVTAGDGIFTNQLNCTFSVEGSVYFAALLKGVGDTPPQITAIPAVDTVGLQSSDPLLDLVPVAAIESAQRLVVQAQTQVNTAVSARNKSPEQAIIELFDFLFSMASTLSQAEQATAAVAVAATAGLGSFQGASLGAMQAANSSYDLDINEIENGTLTQATPRRIDYRTKQGLPCIILAPGEQLTRGPAGCIAANGGDGNDSGNGGARRRLQDINSTQLLVLTALDSGTGPALPQQQAQGQQQIWHQGQHLMPQQPQQHILTQQRRLQSNSNEGGHHGGGGGGEGGGGGRSQVCSTLRGRVLVLEPYLHGCRLEREAELDDVVLLFRQAGYDVTYKCRDNSRCPAGDPLLDDFMGWSAYAAVIVSSRADDNDTGTDPILLTGVPVDGLPSRFRQDWVGNRLALLGDGTMAIRPSWFSKYARDVARQQAGPAIFFSADRTTKGQALFATVLQFAAKARSFSGYDDYLTGKFEAKAQPGTALSQLLLQEKAVDELENIQGRDAITGASFQSIALVPGSKLFDACANLCGAGSLGSGGATCDFSITCPDGSKENKCNPLTGTCDTGCCNKEDGQECSIRGFRSTCKKGVCEDQCEAAVCVSLDPCHRVSQAGQLCDPQEGKCTMVRTPDGASCLYRGKLGYCQNGQCIDRCKGVECSPGPCQLAALCEQETGLCRYLNASDDQWCQPTPPEATGFCQAGTCSGTVEVLYQLSGPLDSLLESSVKVGVTADFARAFEAALDAPSETNNRTIRVRLAQSPRRVDNRGSKSVFQALLAVSFRAGAEAGASNDTAPEDIVLLVTAARFTWQLVTELIGLSTQDFITKMWFIARADSNGTAAETPVLISRASCVMRGCPLPDDECQDVTCSPKTGNCSVKKVRDGTACITTEGSSGICDGGTCTGTLVDPDCLTGQVLVRRVLPGSNSSTATCVCQAGHGGDEIEGCRPCPGGTYSPGGELDTCLPCPGNLTSPLNASSPRACAVGIECPPGMIAPLGARDQSECVCHPGHQPDTSGCSTCPAGTYSFGGGIRCIGCGNLGEFMTGPPGSDSPGKCYDESSCPPGMIDTDASELICACQPGFGASLSGMSCERCPAGTWSTAGAPQLWTTQPCIPCPAGTTSSPGSSGFAACRAASTRCAPTEMEAVDAAARSCVCRPGNGFAENGGICLPCPAGSYSTGGVLGPCQPCNAGFTSLPGSMHRSACFPADQCPPGTIQSSATDGPAACSCRVGYGASALGNLCTQCPSGMYSGTASDNPRPRCQRCPYQASSPAGSTLLSQCFDVSADSCPVGQQLFLPEDVSTQKSCGCLPGYGTKSVESSSQGCSVCPGGTWSSGGGLEPCLACLNNLTSPVASHSFADCYQPYVSCPPGMSASGSAIGCTCKAGTGFIRSMHGMECLTAPVGTFGEGGGREEWQLCPRDLTSPAGSSSIKQCVAAAVVCSGPAAMAPPSAKSLADCLCVPGFEPSGGSCMPCQVGWYSPGGNVTCFPCGIGMTGPLASVHPAFCHVTSQCPQGMLPNAGIKEVTGPQDCVCRPGYGGNVNITACYQCPFGTWSDGTSGRRPCQPCGTGTNTSPEGAAAASECIAVTAACPPAQMPTAAGQCACLPGYAGGSPTAGCTICPAGTYSRGGSIGARCLRCRQGFTSYPGAIDSADCFLPI